MSAYGGTSVGDVFGIGDQVKFNSPYGLVTSTSDPNIIYITDKGNHKVKKIVLSSLEVSAFVGDIAGDRDSN